jgi:signal transduction histidine kinase
MQRVSIYRLIIGFLIAFALLIGLSVLDYQQNASLVSDSTAVNRTHQIIARLANLISAEDVADSDVQLAALTRAPDTIAAARAAIARMAPALADLRTLTADNPNQQQRLDQLEPLLQRHVTLFEAILDGADPKVIQPASETEVDTLIRAMEQEERQQLDVRTTQSLSSVQRTQQIIIGGDMLGLLIGLGTAALTILALRARDRALSDLALLNSQLDARIRQQTAALSDANAQLAALSHQLIATQEVERGTVAATLHEAIGQEIAALQLNLQILDDTSTDPAVRVQLTESMAAIDRVLDQIRALSLDLRPSALDDFGLLEAIHASVEDQLTAHAGIAITVDATPFSVRPPATVETACFRIAQDAIALLLRASAVRSLQIQAAERAGALELTICGDGADPTQSVHEPGANDSALALLEIRERAAAAGGMITITAPTEHGTCIVARFPLDAVVG